MNQPLKQLETLRLGDRRQIDGVWWEYAGNDNWTKVNAQFFTLTPDAVFGPEVMHAVHNVNHRFAEAAFYYNKTPVYIVEGDFTAFTDMASFEYWCSVRGFTRKGA